MLCSVRSESSRWPWFHSSDTRSQATGQPGVSVGRRGGLASAGGVCRSRRAQLTGHQTAGAMGSDVHIRAMWVSAPDERPAAPRPLVRPNLLRAEQTRLPRPRYSLSSTQSSFPRMRSHAEAGGALQSHIEFGAAKTREEDERGLCTIGGHRAAEQTFRVHQ